MECEKVTMGDPTSEFITFFRSEISFEIDKELLNYNQKRQKTIQNAENKLIVGAIVEQANCFENFTPVVGTELLSNLAVDEATDDENWHFLNRSSETIAPSTSSLAEENLSEEAEDTLNNLPKELPNQQNNASGEQNSKCYCELTSNRKLGLEASKIAPKIDNIVVTRTCDNFIRVTEYFLNNFSLLLHELVALDLFLDLFSRKNKQARRKGSLNEKRRDPGLHAEKRKKNKKGSLKVKVKKIDRVNDQFDGGNHLQPLIAAREHNFKLTFRSSKLLLNLLDQKFFPLLEEHGSSFGDQKDRVIHRQRLVCGITCYFDLTLGYYQNQLYLKIAEVSPMDLARTLYHTITFSQHSIYFFCQKLIKKISEFESQKPKSFTRPLIIEGVFKIELLKLKSEPSVHHLIITMLEDQQKQSLILSIPAVYKAVYYLQKFYRMLHKVNSTDVITYWAEEKDYRYEFTLSYIDTKLCLTMSKAAIEEQEEKATLRISPTLISSLEHQLFETIKNSGACLNCGREGHKINGCPKENGYIINHSHSNSKKCLECGVQGHIRVNCPQINKEFKWDTAQCLISTTVETKTPEIGSLSKTSSNSSVQHEPLQNTSENFVPTSTNPCESELRENNVLPVALKPAEFKGKKILVELINNGSSQQRIWLNQIDTISSRFDMSIKTARGFANILKKEFIPKYTSIEDKSATSLKKKYICKSYLKEGTTEFELAFVLNRFHYLAQLVEAIPINGNYIKHTIVVSASQMEHFCQQLENKIEEAESLEQANNHSTTALSNKNEKDDAFFESAMPHSGKTGRKPSEESSSSLTPVGELQMFIKEYENKHYISISDSNTQKMHLSMPVANKCIFYIDEYFKVWKSNGTLASIQPKQWVKEEDCLYDLHYFADQSEPFLRITEKYQNPKTGERTQDSFSVAAHSLQALHRKLLKMMKISGACRQCGLISHPSYHCEKRSVLDFSRVYIKSVCHQCGFAGHYSKDCPESRSVSSASNSKPITSRDDEFAMTSKDVIRPSTLFAKNYSSVEDGLELKVTTICRANGPMYLIQMRQVTNKFSMSITLARSCVKRLEATFIPFCKNMVIMDKRGLAKEIINQSIAVSETYLINLVFFFEKGRFFLRIVEHYTIKKSNTTTENEVTIPAECIQDFCDQLQKKINEAYQQSIGPSIFVSFASSKETERAIQNDVDADNKVTLIWKENRCYILVSTTRAKKSKIELPLSDSKEFISMLKTHQEFYQSLTDKDAKGDRLKFLKETKFDGKESHIRMLFGLKFMGYFLQIVETYFSPIVEGRVERTIVVSGHAIGRFIQQVMDKKQESNACFRCSKSGHRISACHEVVFSHKHCYKCGSFDHFYKNCTTNKTDCLRADPTDKTCYLCQEIGHVKIECPRFNAGSSSSNIG